MNRNRLLNFSFFILLIIYNFFFWKENLGLNIFLFSGMLVMIMKWAYPESFKSGPVRVTLIGTALSGIMVLYFGSAAAKFAHIVSLVLFAAFVHEKDMRSVFFALLHMIRHFLNVPGNFLRRREELLSNRPKAKFLFRIFRLSIIPILVSLVFCLIYSGANPVFGKYTTDLWSEINKLFENLFEKVSFVRILFLLFGSILISGIVFRAEVSVFLLQDLSFADKLERVKQIRRNKNAAISGITRSPIYPNSIPPFKSIALKNENRSGIILLCSVNILLLLENLLDAQYLWFGFQMPENFSLKAYVHEGTGLLILSILMSITILLYYFRKNQNFYPKNKALRILAYAWIAQNIVLSFSVFLRTYHYIDFHGLAYRRIGVDIFLLLTMIGLVTLYIKIRDIRSSYFLVRLNTWSVYAAIVFLGFVNWDAWIAKYNLNHWNKGEVDIDFYLQLSEKTLPIIYSNLDKVNAQIEAHKLNKVKWVRNLDFEKFKERLDFRKNKFENQYNSHSWLSFNFSDYKAYKELKGSKLNSLPFSEELSSR